MTGGDWVTLILGVMGIVLAPLFSVLYVRRKIEAERKKIEAETEESKARATSSEVDAMDKLSDLVNKLQDRNAELYNDNITLEKKCIEKEKVVESLTARLNEREGQLNNANRQIEHFQKLAKDAPIIETLREQLNAMNIISAEFQKAQDATLQLLKEKERAYTELVKITNRDLSIPKVPKE